MILEETYVILFKGLMDEFYVELYNFDTQNLIREGICKDFIRGMVDECNKNIESDKLEAQIREEIYLIVFSEAVKDFGCTHCSALLETQDARVKCNFLEDSTSTDELLHNLEGAIREDVCIVFFEEMVKEWNKGIESNST
ncbi:hypothetical protein L1049_012042 [Liquidambar formosana]|uniref:Uncharacterized protein n=1 Tax=Liquidambar formosana TaxID=63359 RepID=A0AAP0RZ84_LIQFO